MTSFPNLAYTPRLSQGGDKWQGESSLCYLDTLIKTNIIYGPRGPNLYYMTQKYKAQILGLNYSKLF